MKWVFSGWGGWVFVGLGLTASAAAFDLQILHASDLEGGVKAVERAPFFSAIVEGLEKEAAAEKRASILLSAGDNYIPGPFFGASGDRSLRDIFRAVTENPTAKEGPGRGDLTIMNVLGFDASAMGNHDFDIGTSAVAGLFAAEEKGGELRWSGAQFPYLSANLAFAKEPNLAPLFTPEVLPQVQFRRGEAGPKLAPATVIMRGKEKIGVIGATTQQISKISSPGGAVDLSGSGGRDDMMSLAKTLQPTIDQILATGVNKVVLVSHLQQFALEKELVGLLSGVDVVIAGGSDTLLANPGDRLLPGAEAAGPYPHLAVTRDGDPAVVVSTDGEYSYVGRLLLTFDDEGRIASLDGRSGPVASDRRSLTLAGWQDAESAFAPKTKGGKVRLLIEGSTDPVMAGVRTVVNAKDGKVFGKSSVFLDGRRTSVRTGETNLGSLTADANLWAARKVDPTVRVSIKNGGGIRAAIGSIDGSTGTLNPTAANPAAKKKAGEISQLDIANTLRFNSNLVLQTITAEELRQVLEHAVAKSGPGNTPGQFAQVSGVAFSYDEGLQPIVFERNDDGMATGLQQDGQRVREAWVIDCHTDQKQDQLVKNGALVGDPERKIRVVTLDFLAGSNQKTEGGDGYPFYGFGEQAGEKAARKVLAKGEQDVLADYLLARFSDKPFAGYQGRLPRIIKLSANHAE